MIKSFKKVAILPLIIIYLFTTLFSGVSFAYAENSDEQIFYYLHDNLGGIDAVVDENGNVVERKDYLPYGDERLVNGNADENYGFTGKEQDDETGLYYYGARYYDQKIGRFTQIDPLVLNESEKPLSDILQNPQELNGYSYALNNPLKYVDPNGKNPILIMGIALLVDALFVLLNNPQTTFSPDESMATGIAKGEIRSEPTHIIRDSFALVAGEKIAMQIVDYGFKSIGQLRLFKNLTGKGIDAEEAAAQAKLNQKVYRVFGNSSKQYGKSWTPENPKLMENPRDSLGLPDTNAGKYLGEGRLKNIDNIKVKPAEPYGTKSGGATEYLIPDPKNQIQIDKVERVDPKY